MHIHRVVCEHVEGFQTHEAFTLLILRFEEFRLKHKHLTNVLKSLLLTKDLLKITN